MENKNELYHFGVPGMRWGRRKGLTRQNASNYKGRGLTVSQASRQANIDKAKSKGRGISKGKTYADRAVKSKIRTAGIATASVATVAAVGSVVASRIIRKKAMANTVLGIFGKG